MEKIGLQAVMEMASFRNATSEYLKIVSQMSSNTASAASSISSSFGGLGSSILDIGAKAAQIAIGGIATLTLALAGIGVAGTKAFIELEQGFANLEAISGDTKAQLAPLKGLISELALDPNLKVTANEATEALYALTKQGLSVEEIMEGAGRATVELSNATGAQFTPAATIAAGVMKAWNIEASNLSTVADGMTGVLTNSKFTVDDYNLAFAQSGTIFSNLGGSLTDFNTIIGGTAAAFSGGSDAGTSFKNLILTMSAPTKEAKAAMEQYGISIFNADGTMKNWSEVAGQLNKVLYGTVTVTNTVGGATKEQAAAAEKASGSIADLTRDIGQQRDKLQLMNDVYQESLKFYDAGEPRMRAQALAIERLSSNITDQEEQLGEYQQAILAVDGAQAQTITSTKQLTEAERAKLAETIAGRDSSRLLLELGKLTSDQYDELSQKINTNGQAMNAASIRMDTTSGALDILRGIIEAIQLQIGEKFTPMVKAAAKAMSLWASENSGTIIAFFGSVADGMQGMIDGLIKVSGAFQQFGIRGATVSILGQLGLDQTQLAGVMGVFDQVVEAVNKVTGAFERFGLKGATVSILGMLGMDPETIGLIRTTFDTIVEKIGILQQIYAQFGAMGTGISLLSMMGLSSETIALITTSIQSVVDGLGNLANWWTATWPIIQASALTGWEVLKGIFAGFQTALGPILTQLNTQFTQVFTQLGTTIASFGLEWSDVWTALWTATKIVAAGIGAAILGVIGVVAGLASGIAGGVSAAITMLQGLASNVAGIFVGLTGIVVGFNQTLNALLHGNFAAALDGAKVLLQGFATFFINIWGGMLTVATGTLNIITSTISGFVEGIVGFFQGMYNQLVGHSIVPDMVKDIVSWFKKLPQMIASGLSGLVSKITAPFKDVWEGIKEAIKIDEWGALGTSAIEGLLEGMKERAGDVLEFLKNLAADSLRGLGQFWGAQSPATKFMPLGASTMQGVVVGAQSMAGEVAKSFSGLGQSAINALMTGMTATDPRFIHQFIDDLDIGGALRARNVDRNSALGKGISDALKAGVGGFMSQLQGNVGMADVTAWVETIGQQWGQSLSTIAHYVDIGKLYQEIKSKFDEMWSKVRIDNLANAAGIASNFSGFAAGFAGMIESQMETFSKAREEAIKLRDANEGLTQGYTEQQNKLAILQEELAKLTTGNGQNTMAIEKTTEALGFGERQMAIYNEELAKLTPDTLPWDKKKLAIDKLTETMDMQRQQLDKLQAQNDIDTLSIDKKTLAITELTKEMDKNREAIQKNNAALSANRAELQKTVLRGRLAGATSQAQLAGQLAEMELLKEFLAGGEATLKFSNAELNDPLLKGLGYMASREEAQIKFNKLLAEQVRREEEIARQKEAQQKLDFLMQQINLIKLISDRGLNPANILGGITLGLNAGVTDLLAATNRVVEAMVNQINTDLQMGSPSQLMIKIFKQVMAGAAIGMERGQSLLTDAMRSIPILNGSIPQPVFSQAGGVSSSSSSTYNYNFPMTVNTAATAPAVVRQYEIKRSMYAASS